MSSRCKTFSASSAGASTQKGTWWGCSARPGFGRASRNGSSLGASSCRRSSSRRWRRYPGKRVRDGSPIARSLGPRDRGFRRGHAGHVGARAAVGVGGRAGAAASSGACLPYLYLRRRKARFIQTFEEQLPEAIALLGRAIRAGHPLSAGLKMAADEATEPVAGAFRRVFEEQRFGIPFEDALLGLADRIDLVDVRILVTAILIQREVGGNLAEVLDKISHTVRARFTIRRQVRVYTAQGRFSGYVLAVLPIAVGSAIFAINREYMLILFRDPLGHWLLPIGVMLQILGYVWIRRIVHIEI